MPQQQCNLDGESTSTISAFGGTRNTRNKILTEGNKEDPIRSVAGAESLGEAFRRVKQPEEVLLLIMVG